VGEKIINGEPQGFDVEDMLKAARVKAEKFQSEKKQSKLTFSRNNTAKYGKVDYANVNSPGKQYTSNNNIPDLRYF
jgi:hypothetical protein